ncbi:hypothetical protein [Pedobacter terrae]|nr:hypothetical protein [Pedobacter terrae]
MKKEYLERAKEFFEKNTETKAVYFTSDGNMFKAEHYASNWSVGLADKAVTPVTRASILISETITKALANKAAAGLNGDTEVQNPVVPASDVQNPIAPVIEVQDPIVPVAPKSELSEVDEKAELVKRYIELYDTKPNHLTGIEKLKLKIAEKEAELRLAEGAGK